MNTICKTCQALPDCHPDTEGWLHEWEAWKAACDSGNMFMMMRERLSAS